MVWQCSLLQRCLGPTHLGLGKVVRSKPGKPPGCVKVERGGWCKSSVNIPRCRVSICTDLASYLRNFQVTFPMGSSLPTTIVQRRAVKLQGCNFESKIEELRFQNVWIFVLAWGPVSQSGFETFLSNLTDTRASRAVRILRLVRLGKHLGSIFWDFMTDEIFELLKGSFDILSTILNHC